MTDAAALADTHRRAFTDERPWSAGEFADLLDKPTTRLTGDAQSFVLGQIVADEAEVLTLATHPDHRRRGLARAALDAFLDAAATAGAATVFLDVAADNAPALALYARAGFAECGRRPRYYARTGGTAVDAVLMRRDLTQG